MKSQKRILAVGAALAIATTLGACSGGTNPGTAVESLGVRYTETDVTQAADQLTQVLGQNVQRDNVVAVLAVSQAYFKVGEELGMTAQSEEVSSMVEQVLVETGTDPETLSQASSDMLSALVLAQMISPAIQESPEVGAQLEEMMLPPNTVINPRYAQFDPERGLVPAAPFGDVISESAVG